MNELRAHVLTGVPDARAMFRKGSGGLAADESGGVKYLPPAEEGIDPETGLPLPETVPTDDPALDGQLAVQPSVRGEGFDVNAALRWINTAAAVQKATGKKEKEIDWAAIAGAVGAGAATGAAIGGPVGAIVGALIGLFVYIGAAQQEYNASLPWNMYAEQFNWMRGNMPLPAMESVWYSAPEVVAAGIPAIIEYIAAKMLVCRTWDELAADPSPAADLEIMIRDWGWAGQIIVDTDRPLWTVDDGTYIPIVNILTSWGGYETAKAFYVKTGVDYPLSRLMQNPVGSTSADPDVVGITSDGSGGVYMLKGAQYVFEGAIPSLNEDSDTRDDGASSGLILGGLLIAALATKKPTSRKSR